MKPLLGKNVKSDHVIARGLAGCFMLRPGEPELISRLQPTTNNTIIVPTPYGPGIHCSNGQINMEWASKEFIVTSDGVGTGDFTMAILANPTSGTGPNHAFCQKNDPGGTPWGQAIISFNANYMNAMGSFTYTLEFVKA